MARSAECSTHSTFYRLRRSLDRGVCTFATTLYFELQTRPRSPSESIWYIDYGRRLASLSRRHRSILETTALGNTREEVAELHGVSLRTMTRLCTTYGVSPNPDAGARRGRKP